MNSVITINNTYSFLTTDNTKVKQTLWSVLRFRAKNYYHNIAYKRGVWDGYDEFYNPEKGKFLTGLLNEVEIVLKCLECEYEIKDLRKPVEFKYKSIDKYFLQQVCNTDIVLHDYQVDLTNEFLKSYRGTIQAPTGAGKTNIMLAILKCLPDDCPTLILCNKSSVTDQNYKELIKFDFNNAGRVYGKHCEPNMLTCINRQSVHRIHNLLSSYKAMIVDEVHENMAKTNKDLYKKMPNCYIRCAISATAYKFDGKDKKHKYELKGYFGPMLKTESSASVGGLIKTKKLIELGNLSTAECVFYNIYEPKNIEHDLYMDAVKNGIAENYHLAKVIKGLSKKLTGRSLVLVERLNHGDILYEKLGKKTLWVQGKDDLDTRGIVINQLKYSQDDVVAIATKGIFNTGLNVFIHNLINVAGGKAEHEIIQRFGRGLRKADDKTTLKYYDFYFHNNAYLKSHSENRIKILKKEGYKIQIKDIDFDF